MKIRKNIGNADRIVRAILASILISLLVTHAIMGSGRTLLGWTIVAILVITFALRSAATIPAFLMIF